MGAHDWSDWKWQQRNVLRDPAALHLLGPLRSPQGPSLPTHPYNVAITPFYAQLIKTASPGDSYALWRQVAPALEDDSERPDRYDGVRDNWEADAEMLTPLLHQKYPDRAVIRILNECVSLCTFCLEALRTLDPSQPKAFVGKGLWEATLEQLRRRTGIREVIISGGDPLLLDDSRLRDRLRAIRSIAHIETVRIHTRAVTFNPFRITDALAQILRESDVTEVALHVAHPAELSVDFLQAVERLHESRALIQTHTPLLRGVNDDASLLERLWRELYRRHVRPYYFIHCAPFVPGVASFRTSVRRGVEILRQLKRHMSNPAIPEYILVHDSGKKTVPFELDGTSEFAYAQRRDGWPIVRFLNWRSEWVEYLDSPDWAPAASEQQ